MIQAFEIEVSICDIFQEICIIFNILRLGNCLVFDKYDKFRSNVLKGWKYLFPEPDWMTDGMSVVLIGILLFVLPIDESGRFYSFQNLY